MPSDWHLVHLGSRAVGGAGLVILEATAVSPEGRISPRDLGIWSNGHAEAFARITKFIRDQGATAGVQLAHAGRKASVSPPWDGGQVLSTSKGGWETCAPSAIPFEEGVSVPKELRQDEIKRITDDFRLAAERALEAGFEVIEIHMAHGYLLHQFLSPLSNQRNDSYGGDLKGRLRFPLEVTHAVRSVWPERYPLFVRISATDWVEQGWDLPQSIELCKKLKDLGVDLIDVSSGGLIPQARVNTGPGYQVAFSESIRKGAQIATGAVGMITEPQQAEDILSKGKADAVLLARELLRNPYWPLQAARSLGVNVPWPRQYERARP